MRICLFEDARAAWLEPLSLTRPVFDLRCGLTTLGGKLWRLMPGAPGGVLVRPHLAESYRETHPGLPVNDLRWLCEASVLLVNGRWIPGAGEATPSIPGVDFAPLFGTVGPEIAWAVLRSSHLRRLNFDNLVGSLASLAKTSTCRPAGGTMVGRLWELVERNGAEILRDFAATHSPAHQSPKPAGIALIGPAHWLDVSESARIDPFVVVDTTGGPVVVARDAVVHSFSRLEGPCYIGPRSHVLGAKIRAGTTIGGNCRIGGEVECSIVQGNANKYHEGFLGHSYLGEWVNVGAGAHTSDLRLDYGPITMLLGDERIPTGRLKIGSMLGDHTRVGIGSLLNTGTTAGIFCNLLPNGELLPRAIPSFGRVSHGGIEPEVNFDAQLAVAATAMSRRGEVLTPAMRAMYLHLRESAAGVRRAA